MTYDEFMNFMRDKTLYYFNMIMKIERWTASINRLRPYVPYGGFILSKKLKLKPRYIYDIMLRRDRAIPGQFDPWVTDKKLWYFYKHWTVGYNSQTRRFMIIEHNPRSKAW